MAHKIPVISIVAEKSNSGKTTLLEKLIKDLKSRGRKVAVIKHHPHLVEIDRPGKDTWRHAQAGADIVVISGPDKAAFIEKREKELTLDEIIERISGVDIIITEGYKNDKKPKIEVFRSQVCENLISRPDELLAIASDKPWSINVPCFHIDDHWSIADFIESYIESYMRKLHNSKIFFNDTIY
ncbi:MAG: molybdopterin-guanine dinucleotide biosynthesis protein B [Bacillota bacterium]